jgi:ankyrin repeat protein
MNRISNVSLFFVILFMITINIHAQEIFDAIRKADLTKVKELVEKDPQLVKAKNARQSTPLHVAVDVNNEPIARYLIEKGADLNAVNGNNWTPLFYAKEKEIAKLLVEKGADINLNASNGTALSWLLLYRRKEVAEYLLEKGVKLPEIGTIQSIGLLIQSLKSGSIKFLEIYMQQGFNPFYESKENNNLLHYASESNSVELIEKLIILKLPVNKTNIFGFTPLHIAALKGNTQAVKLFTQKGLDINARTNDGKTPYNLAVEEKKDETAEYLKSIGVDQSPQRFPVFIGEYMGQLKPGKKAVLFAPGIVTSQHGSIVLTPDGNEMYWSINKRPGEVSMISTKKKNGKWTKPDTLKKDIDVPFVSPDGNKLFCTQWNTQTKWGIKTIISVMDKTPAGWSEPKPLPDIINSVPGIHWQVSVDSKENLYFGARQNGAIHNMRIYYSEYNNGEYREPKIIEGLKDVNAHSPYISPDGSYLIISKPGGLNILFKKRNGSWTDGIGLADYTGIKGGKCPIVTHDGKYLFFISGTSYWVDASFIEELRKKELKEY